jgi:hypothetical protein
MVLDRFMLGMKWIQMKRSETSANFVSIGELEFGACTQAEVHRAAREENVVIESFKSTTLTSGLHRKQGSSTEYAIRLTYLIYSTFRVMTDIVIVCFTKVSR